MQPIYKQQVLVDSKQSTCNKFQTDYWGSDRNDIWGIGFGIGLQHLQELDCRKQSSCLFALQKVWQLVEIRQGLFMRIKTTHSWGRHQWTVCVKFKPIWKTETLVFEISSTAEVPRDFHAWKYRIPHKVSCTSVKIWANSTINVNIMPDLKPLIHAHNVHVNTGSYLNKCFFQVFFLQWLNPVCISFACKFLIQAVI